MAAATGGALLGPDVEVDGAAIDSRRVRPGELFVPLVAGRDGHDYIDAARDGGAAATLSQRRSVRQPAVVVPDTRAALHDLAGHGRSLLGDRVVGVTGSVGKTTVKDLLVGALGTRFATAATAGNENNELGVPRTLLGAPDGTEALVVEMGACAVGDIALLVALARPTVGVVTSVGLAHTQSFGTLAEVARAKGELAEGLDPSGTAVLNGDDPLVATMAGRTEASVLLFGLGSGAAVTASGITLDAGLRASFRLHSPWGGADVRLAVSGHHQVSNALAAAAAALVAGVEPDGVAEGLGRARLSPGRMALVRTPGGAQVIDDAYNANPLSLASALRSLAALAARRRVAVLGTMAELGEVAEREHRAAAALAADLGIRVVAVDEPRYGVEVVGGVDGALAALGALGEGDAVLVKGSRVAGLERLVARLAAAAPP